MQSEGNDNASPGPNLRRTQRQNRQHQQPPNPDTQSDSNIPNATTPKPRKTSRQPQHGERTSFLATSSNRQPSSATGPRTRPPPGAAAATPSKPSYAGAAFHASPAPSSLPVPKFFSRSVPSANADSGLQAKLEREGSADGSPGAGLAPQPATAGSKSPLDMFFNADRQEKARKQSSRDGTETPSKARDMFMLELDEASSPASHHNTPIPLRRRPAEEQSRPSPDNVSTLHPDEARRAAQTQSLKTFLNITSAEADSTPPTKQPSFATPTHNMYQQNNDLHYGNRDLSPLFHAARSPNNTTSPAHQPSYPSPHSPSNYASVYNNPYASSPSKPAPSNPHPFQQHNPHWQNPPRSPGPHPSTFISPRQQNPPDDLKDMEDRMKRMLRMS